MFPGFPSIPGIDLAGGAGGIDLSSSDQAQSGAARSALYGGDSSTGGQTFNFGGWPFAQRSTVLGTVNNTALMLPLAAIGLLAFVLLKGRK